MSATTAPTSNGKVIQVIEIPDQEVEKEQNEDEKHKEVSYFSLYRYADWIDYLLIVVGTLASAAHGSALQILFIVLGDLTDAAISLQSTPCTNISNSNISNFTAENRDFLYRSVNDRTIYFACIAAAIIVVGTMQISCWGIVGIRLIRKIRIRYFQSILKQDIGFFDINSAGELNARMSDDISTIQKGINENVSFAVANISRFLAGMLIGFFHSWRLSLVVLGCSPVIGIISAIMFKLPESFTKKELDAYAKAGAIAEEVLSSIHTVVAFGGQKKEIKRYSGNLDAARKVGIRKAFFNGLNIGLFMFIVFSAYGLAFWYGATLVLDNIIPVGDVLTSFFAILISAFSVGQVGINFQQLMPAKAAAYKIFELIDRVPSIDSSSDRGLKPDRIIGEVRFDKVSFAYPSRSDVKVLRNVSFKAESGKTTALCGQSGSGKSTCIQLIQRFYDPQAGTVEIDGIDIRTLNVRWFREHIGVVSQEPVLFDTTIAENIRYGRENVTDQEIEEATKKSNAYDFIMELPNKFETLVGEGGVQMSGGQKQRIAIARAIVRDPKILLLDEATSALDTKSEAIVQAALERASEGRTTIVIAHRLSTIKNSNKIIGFSEGRPMEEGTHEELLKVPNGVYQNLIVMQSSDPNEGEKSNKLQRDTCHNEQGRFNGDSNVQPNIYGSNINENLHEYSFFQILKLNKPETCFILIGCVSAVFTGAVQPLFGIFLGEVVGIFSTSRCNQEQIDEVLNQIVIYTLLFVAIGGGLLIGNIGLFSSFGKSGEELTFRLRQMAFRTMLQQDMRFFDDHLNNTGALTARLATDASKVQGGTGIQIATALRSLISLCVALGFGLAFGWELTLIVIAFMPIIAIGGMMEMRYRGGHASQQSSDHEEAGKLSAEATRHIRTVASLGVEDMLVEKFVMINDAHYKKSLMNTLIFGLVYGFSQATVFFSYAAAFRAGVWLVDIDRMEIRDVFKVLITVIYGAVAFGESMSFAPQYADAKVSACRLLKLFNTKPKIDSYSSEGISPTTIEGSVSFNNVSFTYPTRADVQVLQGLSMVVQPGRTLALVGQSGCGKSTCFRLLERFYDADTGTIKIDNNNTKDLQISWLRSQLSVVSQEPILFNYSIADNIKYGDNSRQVSMEEVIAATKKANIFNFIQQLPMGFHTVVGSKGTQLSGGEKQRVAIARALIRNPKILLLDEATSALDTESEKIVQEALDHAREGRTCIVIAHRLSTVKNADVIAVVENGKIVESGTHSELLSRQAAYHNLVEAQLLKEY